MRKAAVHMVVVLAFMFSGILSAQEYVPPQAKVFVEEGDTADISGKIEDRDSKGDFGMAITAALYKKKVPVLVVTDPEKADYVIQHSSTRDEESTGTKIATRIFVNPFSSGVKFEGAFMVIDQENSTVVFSYNVKKNNFQSAADAFAKHFKNHIKDGVKKSGKQN